MGMPFDEAMVRQHYQTMKSSMGGAVAAQG